MTTRVRTIRWWLGPATVFGCFFTATAWSHKPSDSYLTLRPQGTDVQIRWDVALRDLDGELGLDSDDDGTLTWGEVRRRQSDIEALVLPNLHLRSRSRECLRTPREQQTATALALDNHSDGTYAVLEFTVSCGVAIQSLEVEYRLFSASDPSHRGIVRVETVSGLTTTAVLGPEAPRREFSLADRSRLETLREFIVEGIWHIWLGFDHILFLLALLLPAVLVRAPRDSLVSWLPRPTLAAALIDVLKIVTAFTIAHSITLTIAVLGFVSLPSRFVESGIALTVFLSAVNNLKPVLRERRWVAAFVFGLIHGFGFASALMDLGLSAGALGLSLFGFNVGVELGQLAIVAVFVPAAFLLRATRFYQRGILLWGSAVVALIAVVWFIERAWNIALAPTLATSLRFG